MDYREWQKNEIERLRNEEMPKLDEEEAGQLICDKPGTKCEIYDPEDGTITRFLPTAPRVPSKVTVDRPKCNVFRRMGSVWEISFDGKIEHVKHAVGLDYLSILMRNRTGIAPLKVLLLCGKHIAAEHTNSDDVVPHAGSSFDDVIIDDRSMKAIAHRLEDIDGLLEAERQRGNNEAADALRDERKRIEDFRRKDTRPAVSSNGRRYAKSRHVADEEERARSRITKAINEAYQIIAAVHPSAAAHFQKHIKTGRTMSYEDDLTQWDL